MSMMHPVDIECPQCGEKSTFTIHDSINVTLDPEDKKKVLDKSIFLFHCEKCNFETYFDYGPLYHDMTEKYMIMVVPDPETARKSTIPKIEEGKFSMVANGYRLRVVCGIAGLVEKIRIFDNGLSDYAVELLKAKLFSCLGGPTEIYFTEITEDRICFHVFYDDSARNTEISVERNWYDMCVAALKDQNLDPDAQYVDKEIFAGLFDAQS